MKNVLKMSTLLFILVGIICCNSDNSINGQRELIGSWELMKFQDQTSTTIMTDLDNFGPIIITFNKEDFEGNTGSNIFFGSYTKEFEVLVFFEFYGSEAGESEWGSKFQNAIVSTYNINDKNYHMSFTIEGTTLKIGYELNRFMFFEKL